MKYMTMNNRKVAFDDEKNVLSVIRKAGINLPTFCYHSELSTYGACRMCVVEDDRGKIFASCSEVPRDGMVIYTNTPKLQHHRKMILELMLSAHCRECTTCKKNGDCTLQNLAKQLGVSYIRFENNKPQIPIDESSDCIVIDKNKCILCGDCVRTCEEIQGLGILDFAYRGSKMQVMPAFDRKMAETACVGCGQCRVVCPTGAITIKHNIHPVWEALADKNTRVVVQIAPAVRVAVGDKFGIPKGENSLGKLVAALRRMGFDEIYDTDFGADLTIMEESKEFLERVKSGEKLPLFTSCCPAWVKFCEQKYPELRENISTCRSPQQMFGAVVREYYKDPEKNEGKKNYIGGGEESYGFLCEDFVRDKDAVSACAILAEIAAWAKDQGITMYQLLQNIYVQYGFSKEKGISVVKKGKSGAEEIEAMMKHFRENPLQEIAGSKVTLFYDYASLKGKDYVENETLTLDMPTTSNVLQYFTEDGTKVSIRPSGTEPKIKFYCEVHSKVKSLDELPAAEKAGAEKIEAIKASLGI